MAAEEAQPILTVTVLVTVSGPIQKSAREDLCDLNLVLSIHKDILSDPCSKRLNRSGIAYPFYYHKTLNS